MVGASPLLLVVTADAAGPVDLGVDVVFGLVLAFAACVEAVVDFAPPGTVSPPAPMPIPMPPVAEAPVGFPDAPASVTSPILLQKPSTEVKSEYIEGSAVKT